MKTPILFSIDDDPQVLRAIQRDLRTQYRKDYKVIATTSANEALESLVELKNQGEEVALFLSDQKMPEMQGVDFLEKAREIFPKAKRVLLTAYSDTDAAIKAINEVQLDYYLLKPWDPPEEKLYPVINDLLEEWLFDYRPAFAGIKVLGYAYSPKSHGIKDFLSGNLKPYLWLDVQVNEEATTLLEINGLSPKDLPVIFFEDGSFLTDPSIIDIASHIGLNPKASEELYDVAIIGAGPAGLAAAVYGASEGLKSLLIERKAPGGQAGTSSRIENYLGFPSGLSGSDLARRAITQATRFGAEFLSPQEVKEIEIQEGGYKKIHLGDGSVVHARSVVVTTGVDYRKLETEGLEKFTGAGVYYGAATTEASACKDKEVAVVGGGNSAGQAAVYLSNYARKVRIIIRKDDLTSTMSSYLIDQIQAIPNIELVPNSEVSKALGDEYLSSIEIKSLKTGETTSVDNKALFIFIGAKPYTQWLDESVIKDPKGFVETGRNLLQYTEFKKQWRLDRDPYVLETSIPGIFAAGDVRSGAMNRVASAVGEGSMSISLVHKYLAEV